MKRLLGTIAGLALSAILAGPGLCITAMTPLQNGSGEEHDCCQTGIRSSSPECCTGSMMVGAPARITAKVTAESAATSDPILVLGGSSIGQAVKPAAVVGAPHLRVPPVILRV